MADINIASSHEPIERFRGDHTTNRVVPAGRYARVVWKLNANTYGKVAQTSGTGSPDSIVTESDSDSMTIEQWVKAGDTITTARTVTPASVSLAAAVGNSQVINGTFIAQALLNALVEGDVTVNGAAGFAQDSVGAIGIDLDVFGKATATWYVEEYIVQGF